jgi:hypothetical protein
VDRRSGLLVEMGIEVTEERPKVGCGAVRLSAAGDKIHSGGCVTDAERSELSQLGMDKNNFSRTEGLAKEFGHDRSLGAIIRVFGEMVQPRSELRSTHSCMGDGNIQRTIIFNVNGCVEMIGEWTEGLVLLGKSLETACLTPDFTRNAAELLFRLSPTTTERDRITEGADIVLPGRL